MEKNKRILNNNGMSEINLTSTTREMVNKQTIEYCKKENLKYKYMNGDIHPIYKKRKKKQKSLLNKLCKLVGL